MPSSAKVRLNRPSSKADLLHTRNSQAPPGAGLFHGFTGSAVSFRQLWKSCFDGALLDGVDLLERLSASDKSFCRWHPVDTDRREGLDESDRADPAQLLAQPAPSETP